jgi:hypothetical protein
MEEEFRLKTPDKGLMGEIGEIEITPLSRQELDIGLFKLSKYA